MADRIRDRSTNKTTKMGTLTYYDWMQKRYVAKPGVTDEEIFKRLARMEQMFMIGRMIYMPVCTPGDTVWIIKKDRDPDTLRNSSKYYIEEHVIQSLFINSYGRSGFHIWGDKWGHIRNMTSYRTWWFMDYDEAVLRCQMYNNESNLKPKEFWNMMLEKDRERGDELDKCEWEGIEYLRRVDFTKAARRRKHVKPIGEDEED